MATSSIFHNVVIDTPEAAERFVNALEEASKMPKRKPTSDVKLPLTDKEAIRALFLKGTSGE